MPTIPTSDGTEIYHEDRGPRDAQPIAFHHGRPLSSGDWDAQMLFFASHGYRVVAHDRRGHGRSAQVPDGHDTDHYAADAAAVARQLDLRGAVHIGRSTGGGEVARYAARFGEPRGRVADNRGQFFLDVPTGPFHGFDRDGATVLPGVIQNWWRQGMMGSAEAHYEGIKAFSETDQAEDLKGISAPTLLLHGEDDQIVPIAGAALKAIGLPRNGTLKTYPGLSHGMLTVNADVLNADLLTFVRD